MKKSYLIILVVVVVVVLAVGGYALFHKSSDNKQTATQITSSSTSNAIIVTKTDATIGGYLADPSGKPLYTYGADTSGISNCTGACLSNWPAYEVTTSSASLPTGISIITRTDNSKKQYAYNGMPLYYFTGDSAGKVTGNGVENFTVAKPASSSSQSTTPSNNTGNSSSGYNY